MDTKLKNSKTKIAVKATAFILMLALVMSGALMFAGSSSVIHTVCKSDFEDISDIIMKNDYPEVSFWYTTALRDDLSGDALCLYLYAKYFYDEAAVNDGTAFAKLENDLKAQMEKGVADEIYAEWQTAKSKARENLISIIWNHSEQDIYDRFIKQYPDLDINTIQSADNLTDEMLTWYIENYADYKPNEKEIRNRRVNEYNENVESAKSNFHYVYKTVTERVKKLDSLQYVIILPDGSRLTNFSDGKFISEEELKNTVLNSDVGYLYSRKYGAMHALTRNNELLTPWLLPDSYAFESSNNPYGKQIELLKIDPLVFWTPDSDYLFEMCSQNNMDLFLFSSENWIAGTDGYGEKYGTYLAAREMIIPSLIMIAAAFVILILLIIFSGSKNPDGSYSKSKFDKIYNDLHFIISAFIGFLAFYALILSYNELFISSYSKSGNAYMYTLLMLSAAALWTICAEWLMSVSRQIKAKTLFSHTAIWKFLKFIKRKSSKINGKLKTKIKKQSEKLRFLKHRVTHLRRDTWLFVALFTVGNFVIAYLIGIFYLSERALTFFCVILLIIYNIAVAVFLWKSIVALDKIMRAVSSAEQGNLNVTLDIASMPRWIRKFAQDVQDMQNGMRAAVAEAVKGERMKTELITNVSHDLKTPLTSIVTYVDLLKKRPIDDGEALEYIAVLDEKSARLKHLIEDLVEASKTTTGSVELHPVKINLYELALQSVGENEDALNTQGLDVRLSAQPEKSIVVYADNQKTWRIIENLISNVRKYAMSGTRVYISVEEKDSFGVFSVKNITREPIDVPASELTARFMRGDSSRSTEGSGLGLSIASNLCELQGGKLDLTIDGDLFKATVYLPLAKE